mmetsp:Transcript_2070/g.4855  ORF Transcript_2070/g.4855 Transcript_2070/m.4855 type:complete len:99 (+) Transcript_2070:196-492(+)
MAGDSPKAGVTVLNPITPIAIRARADLVSRHAAKGLCVLPWPLSLLPLLLDVVIQVVILRLLLLVVLLSLPLSLSSPLPVLLPVSVSSVPVGWQRGHG